MPIYEYACKPCGKVFEELVIRRSDEDQIVCPSCSSGEVSRVMSRPAAARADGAGGGRPSRSCGPVG
jgi:putative FmdB family regulatory protein